MEVLKQLSVSARATIVAGGVAAVLGLYWDDAWHTDVGRDAFLSPPHLLLYAGVAALFAASIVWARRGRRGVGPEVPWDPAVLLALGGAAITLAAAPVDELWHRLFGRDAVVWSPPHMVAVAGMLAFAAGLYLGVQRHCRRSAWLSAFVGGFLIAAATTPVMEYEADVPQFAQVWYWPVLAATLVFAFTLVRAPARRPWPATAAAAVYVGLRLVVVGFLASLGHSLPTVMPTIVPAIVDDQLARRGVDRHARSSIVAVAIVASHAVAHRIQPAGLQFSLVDVLVGGLLAVAAANVVTWAVTRRVGRRRSTTVSTAGLALVTLVVLAQPAMAHDPGQGFDVAPITLEAVRHGDRIFVTAEGHVDACDEWQASGLVARRAGRLRVAELARTGPCTFAGEVRVDEPGRWFVYVELDVDGAPTEAWIPVDVASQRKDTTLYHAPQVTARMFQLITGIVLYAGVLVVLGAVVSTFGRSSDQPASPPAASGVRRDPRSGSTGAIGGTAVSGAPPVAATAGAPRNV